MRTFKIDDDDYDAVRAWQADHECSAGQTAIGGRFTYKFTPTGIGTFSSVACVCGAIFHITDGSDF